MELVIIRHGETDWNRLERCQGVSDIPLNTTGRDQAKRLAESLKKEKFSAIFSSDLIRARETAEAIADVHSLGVEYDTKLREMDQGEFEGLEFTHIREQYSDVLKQWTTDPENLRIPGGETLLEVQSRAWDAFSNIYDKFREDRVLVVSHNLTIITLLCKFSGKSLSSFREFIVRETSKSVVMCEESNYRISLLNDVGHLDIYKKSDAK